MPPVFSMPWPLPRTRWLPPLRLQRPPSRPRRPPRQRQGKLRRMPLCFLKEALEQAADEILDPLAPLRGHGLDPVAKSLR